MNSDEQVRRDARTPLLALRRLVQPQSFVERCELCSVVLTKEHPHLIEPVSRQLLCSCDACGVLFSGPAGKYRRVSRDRLFLPDFKLTDEQWEQLLIPIGMAFFFYSSAAERIMAIYPSPAGPTESLPAVESWKEIVSANPILSKLEPDVSGLLVNRIGATPKHYLVPIDECYKLVGLIRSNWRGLSGGTEVWQEIATFFSSLEEQARVAVAASI